MWLHAKQCNYNSKELDRFVRDEKLYKSEFSLPSRILRLGQNFQQLVVGQEEESREEETFPLQIFVQTLLDIL